LTEAADDKSREIIPLESETAGGLTTFLASGTPKVDEVEHAAIVKAMVLGDLSTQIHAGFTQFESSSSTVHK